MYPTATRYPGPTKVRNRRHVEASLGSLTDRQTSTSGGVALSRRHAGRREDEFGMVSEVFKPSARSRACSCHCKSFATNKSFANHLQEGKSRNLFANCRFL